MFLNSVGTFQCWLKVALIFMMSFLEMRSSNLDKVFLLGSESLFLGLPLLLMVCCFLNFRGSKKLFWGVF